MREIDVVQVSGEMLNRIHHSRSQDIGAIGKDVCAPDAGSAGLACISQLSCKTLEQVTRAYVVRARIGDEEF